MDELAALEKEVSSLRSLLAEKEGRLNALRSRMLVSMNQPPQQTLLYEEPQYDLKPVEQFSAGYQPLSHIGQKLPRWAIERYSRQILLPSVGAEGQALLCGARALVVGAGGLGCPAAAYLAGAGVGVIGIADYDMVDVTNLHRQLLHAECDQGISKAESAAKAIRRLNSQVCVNFHRLQLTAANALEVLAEYEVVLDCTDNVPTRYLLNDACVLLKIPLISGSALKLEGQLTIYGYRPSQEDKDPGPAGPCYRCLFPVPPPPETVGSCSAQGVLGPIPGVIGTLQALEAIKLLSRRPQRELLVGRMLLLDGEDCSFRNVKLRGQSTECAACSEHATITELMDYEAFCHSKAKEKKKEEARLKSLRRKEEKEKRMSGRSYFGFRRSRDTKEKWVQDVPKRERKMGPRCNSDFCAKGLTRRCAAFANAQRQEIFTGFWNEMDWAAKKSFVRSLVDSTPPKRRRTKHKGEFSRKGDSKVYHLMNGEERAPVCRVMFLNTLGIKEAMVRCWLMMDEAEKPRGPKKKPIKALNVERYLEDLPKLPPRCQYCRSFTTRLYLEPCIKNQHQLYNRYVQDMTAKGVGPASRKTFTKVFMTKNLGIFKPKQETDVCDLFSQHNSVAVPPPPPEQQIMYQPITIEVIDQSAKVEQDIDLAVLPPENRISAKDLAAKLSSLSLSTEKQNDSEKRHLLVDVRSEPEFLMCRIDGAVNYPIDSLAKEETFQKLIEDVKTTKSEVTFVCRRGNDSQLAAARVLRALAGGRGAEVRDVAGGLHAWARDVDAEFPVY